MDSVSYSQDSVPSDTRYHKLRCFGCQTADEILLLNHEPPVKDRVTSRLRSVHISAVLTIDRVVHYILNLMSGVLQKQVLGTTRGSTSHILLLL